MVEENLDNFDERLRKKYKIAEDIVYELVTSGYVESGYNVTVYLQSSKDGVKDLTGDAVMHKATVQGGVQENYVTIEVDINHEPDFNEFKYTEKVRNMTDQRIDTVHRDGDYTIRVSPYI